MSADNGIYILETKVNPRRSFPELYEYRVAHLQAIDNVNWDRKNNKMCNNPDIQIENARDMWRNCKVITNIDDAFDIAERMEDSLLFTEYGISVIKIPRKF